MIISRTPYRVSLLGGGSDYPDWFKVHGGRVLSTTINKYCYISVRWLPPFFEHKHRIVWSQIENVSKVDDIQHNSVRECLKYLDIYRGISLHHDGDLPARSGMGSSSAFTVGLLKALYHLNGCETDNHDIAYEAINVEQNFIKDKVGNQDQIACAVGGFNEIVFDKNGYYSINPVLTEHKLEENLMLLFTGLARDSSSISTTYELKPSIHKMMRQVQQGYEILLYNRDIREFGKLLDDAWQEKKKLSPQISSTYIDFIYDTALHNGAIGGKLLGAGGGGFMLLFCEPAKQEQVKKSLKGMLWVPFKFEKQGSQIILNNGGGDDRRYN